jgi:hypothetical protein
MLLALSGLVYGTANHFTINVSDAKDTAALVFDVPVFFNINVADAVDKASLTFVVPRPNDAVDAAQIRFNVSFANVLDQLPLLRVRYGCSGNEDFNLVLFFPEDDVEDIGFSLSIGFKADVATIAGVVNSTYHSVQFYVPAASGPTAWVDEGTGGSGPGNFVIRLLVTESTFTKDLFQFSSFVLGESIPPEIVPVKPFWPKYQHGTPFAPAYQGPPPFPLN